MATMTSVTLKLCAETFHYIEACSHEFKETKPFRSKEPTDIPMEINDGRKWRDFREMGRFPPILSPLL